MAIVGADGLTLAGVNGTILAIVVAGLTGFFFLGFQTIDKMETELIEEANRVNGKRPIIGWESPPFSTDGLAIDRLRSLFMALAHGDEREHEYSDGESLLPRIELPPKGDLAARGNALSRVMAAAVIRYPFVAKDENYEPLQLNDLPSILKWASDFEVVLWSFSANLRNTRDYVARLAEAADEAAADMKERYFRSVKANSPIGLETTAYEEQRYLNRLGLKRFSEFIESSSEISQATIARIKAIKRYRARFPSRALVLAATSVVLVAFVCGVAIPMIHPSVSSAVDAWIPVALYALSLGFGAFRISRRYDRSMRPPLIRRRLSVAPPAELPDPR